MLHNGSATPAPGSYEPDSHDGLSLGEFAEQRGISKDAARRLVKAGKVQAHRVAGVHGPEWCVHLDSPVESRHGSAGDAPGMRNGPATVAPGSDLAGLVALVDRLQVENRQLAEAAATWQTRAMMLADQLALAAPQQPVDASTAPESPDPTTELPPPWWRWIALLAPVLVTAGVVAVVLLIVPR